MLLVDLVKREKGHHQGIRSLQHQRRKNSRSHNTLTTINQRGLVNVMFVEKQGIMHESALRGNLDPRLVLRVLLMLRKSPI
ncbi:hypothetical protein HanHA300_Chr03g0073721 [Helianthus annuus]|nr:hypothetical protein HanHA89_Chr13g0531471 [Helianthus annuus]KAJ0591474.1 hypothetical protein HanHA300_Chr03g0073721 [Helianthus annuus]KAJ0773768.1 hypothetical protein HanOQP8_Chr03g0104041 [Helianthus annuus]